MSVATIVHFAVADLLHRSEFPLAESNELVEAACIAVGLGVLRNQMSFVKQSPRYWDSTSWDAIPRPFLDPTCLAYVNGLAAWFRQDKDNVWIGQLHTEIVKSAKKTLKYLIKTEDSFLHPNSLKSSIGQRTSSEWLQSLNQKSLSSQLAALQFFAGSKSFPDDHQDLLIAKLQSNEDAVVVHAINVAQSIAEPESSVINELRMLTESRDEITQSKAMMALTAIKQLDQNCFDTAVKMLQDNTQHVVYTGLVALSTKDEITEAEQKVVHRAFLKYLQSCNYEFVNLFVLAYSRWYDDVKAYLANTLQQDHPEYLDIALEVVESI